MITGCSLSARRCAFAVVLVSGVLGASGGALSPVPSAAGIGKRPQGPAVSSAFRAAAVKTDITPQNSQWLLGYQARQSNGIHDRIYHRVLALEAGPTRFYLISSDLCLFSPTFYDAVTRDLQKETGIDPAHVWWSVTHTHAAPEVGPPDMYKALLGRSDHEWDREYTSMVTKTLIDAVRTARNQLEPARLAFGSGASMANLKRRARDVDGRISLG